MNENTVALVAIAITNVAAVVLAILAKIDAQKVATKVETVALKAETVALKVEAVKDDLHTASAMARDVAELKRVVAGLTDKPITNRS